MTAGAAGCEENEGPIIHGPVLQGIFRHSEEPTGPALLGRPDDRLRDEAIHIEACCAMDCFASLAMTSAVSRRLRGAKLACDHPLQRRDRLEILRRDLVLRNCE